MTDKDALFAGSVPELYDRLLVPMIFEPYAQDLARRLRTHGPRSVLELAAGTGVVTRALAAALPNATIVATDLNQPMLDQAMKRQPSTPNLAWQQADAQSLPFGAGSFDAVACQFGAMFFPDKVSAYRETLRVLKSGGLFLFNVWDRLGANEFAAVVTETLARIFPEDPPQFLARTPHGYHDVQMIQSQLTQAGFGDVRVETVVATSRSPSAHDVALAYCQGTPLRNEIIARDAARLEEATQVAAQELSKRFGPGPLSGQICAHVVSARI